jgi:hypothetical protein
MPRSFADILAEQMNHRTSQPASAPSEAVAHRPTPPSFTCDVLSWLSQSTPFTPKFRPRAYTTQVAPTTETGSPEQAPPPQTKPQTATPARQFSSAQMVALQLMARLSSQYMNGLTVSEFSSDAEIKRAYRKLARILHPDMNQKSNATQLAARTEQFRTLHQAYEILIAHQ